MAGFYEYDNKFSDSMKAGEFLDQQSDNQILKKSCQQMLITHYTLKQTNPDIRDCFQKFSD